MAPLRPCPYPPRRALAPKQYNRDTTSDDFPVPGSHRRRLSALLLSSGAAVLVGCTSGAPESEAASPTPAQAALEISHVHGVGADPADGTLFLATHKGRSG